ncbi:MAG: N-6 DNA methylase [Pirellulales bacterium]|nr:N-6 DNA methylase [Pirellulales bacterium]
MGKEFFTLDESKELLKLFETVSRQTGHNRSRIFSDFLTVTVCALAGQTMEDEYMQTIEKGYTNGKPGSRGIDTLTTAFGFLVNAMETTGQDVLGDVFQGAITYGENGQFFTPDSVCDLMAKMSVPTERTDEPKTICDPACGSGRQLLAVAKHQPHWEFTGQDLDIRCTQMTAINLGLNGLKGWAVNQNTLTLETRRVFRIGMFFTGTAAGVIREVPVEQSPFNYVAITEAAAKAKNANPVQPKSETSQTTATKKQQPNGQANQLDLF